jgi:hypothetical protein
LSISDRLQPETKSSATAIFFPAISKFVSLQIFYPREVFSSLPLLKYDEKLFEGWGQIVSLLWLKQKVKDQRHQIVDKLSTVETRSTKREERELKSPAMDHCGSS